MSTPIILTVKKQTEAFVCRSYAIFEELLTNIINKLTKVCDSRYTCWPSFKKF